MEIDKLPRQQYHFELLKLLIKNNKDKYYNLISKCKKLKIYNKYEEVKNIIADDFSKLNEKYKKYIIYFLSDSIITIEIKKKYYYELVIACNEDATCCYIGILSGNPDRYQDFENIKLKNVR